MIRELAIVLASFASPLQELGPGDALWERGQRVEALEEMARALAERPSDADLRAQLAAREMQVRRFASALEHAEVLGPKLDPLRGRALFFLGRYEEALPYLRPDDTELILLRVESLRALGRLEAMESLIPDAAALLGAGAPAVSLLCAERAERAGELRAAAAHYRAALAREPLSAQARFGLGRALVQSGEREAGLAVLAQHRALTPLLDALDFAQRGVELAPLHAENQAALGDAWRALASFDRAAVQRAEDCYRRAAANAEGSAIAATALRHARLLCEDRGDVPAALRVLDEALARSSDARLHVRAADVLASAGRRAEALDHLRAALALRPGDDAVLERIAALEAQASGGGD